MVYCKTLLALVSLIWVSSCEKDGEIGVTRELWEDVKGSSIQNLLADSRFPHKPSKVNLLTSFDAPVDDKISGAAQRIRGYFVAPVSGAYKFFSSCNGRCEVFLGFNGMEGENNRVVSQKRSSKHNQFMHSPDQVSHTIALEKSKRYYLEAINKQGSGGPEHLSVGVELPDGSQLFPIPQSMLRRYKDPQQTETNKAFASFDSIVAVGNAKIIVPRRKPLQLEPVENESGVIRQLHDPASPVEFVGQKDSLKQPGLHIFANEVVNSVPNKPYEGGITFTSKPQKDNADKQSETRLISDNDKQSLFKALKTHDKLKNVDVIMPNVNLASQNVRLKKETQHTPDNNDIKIALGSKNSKIFESLSNNLMPKSNLVQTDNALARSGQANANLNPRQIDPQLMGSLVTDSGYSPRSGYTPPIAGLPSTLTNHPFNELPESDMHDVNMLGKSPHYENEHLHHNISMANPDSPKDLTAHVHPELQQQQTPEVAPKQRQESVQKSEMKDSPSEPTANEKKPDIIKVEFVPDEATVEVGQNKSKVSGKKAGTVRVQFIPGGNVESTNAVARDSEEKAAEQPKEPPKPPVLQEPAKPLVEPSKGPEPKMNEGDNTPDSGDKRHSETKKEEDAADEGDDEDSVDNDENDGDDDEEEKKKKKKKKKNKKKRKKKVKAENEAEKAAAAPPPEANNAPKKKHKSVNGYEANPILPDQATLPDMPGSNDPSKLPAAPPAGGFSTIGKGGGGGRGDGPIPVDGLENNMDEHIDSELTTLGQKYKDQISPEQKAALGASSPNTAEKAVPGAPPDPDRVFFGGGQQGGGPAGPSVPPQEPVRPDPNPTHNAPSDPSAANGQVINPVAGHLMSALNQNDVTPEEALQMMNDFVSGNQDMQKAAKNMDGMLGQISAHRKQPAQPNDINAHFIDDTSKINPDLQTGFTDPTLQKIPAMDEPATLFNGPSNKQMHMQGQQRHFNQPPTESNRNEGPSDMTGARFGEFDGRPGGDRNNMEFSPQNNFEDDTMSRLHQLSLDSPPPGDRLFQGEGPTKIPSEAERIKQFSDGYNNPSLPKNPPAIDGRAEMMNSIEPPHAMPGDTPFLNAPSGIPFEKPREESNFMDERPHSPPQEAFHEGASFPGIEGGGRMPSMHQDAPPNLMSDLAEGRLHMEHKDMHDDMSFNNYHTEEWREPEYSSDARFPPNDRNFARKFLTPGTKPAAVKITGNLKAAAARGRKHDALAAMYTDSIFPEDFADIQSLQGDLQGKTMTYFDSPIQHQMRVRDQKADKRSKNQLSTELKASFPLEASATGGLYGGGVRSKIPVSKKDSETKRSKAHGNKRRPRRAIYNFSPSKAWLNLPLLPAKRMLYNISGTEGKPFLKKSEDKFYNAHLHSFQGKSQNGQNTNNNKLSNSNRNVTNKNPKNFSTNKFAGNNKITNKFANRNFLNNNRNNNGSNKINKNLNSNTNNNKNFQNNNKNKNNGIKSLNINNNNNSKSKNIKTNFNNNKNVNRASKNSSETVKIQQNSRTANNEKAAVNNDNNNSSTQNKESSGNNDNRDLYPNPDQQNVKESPKNSTQKDEGTDWADIQPENQPSNPVTTNEDKSTSALNEKQKGALSGEQTGAPSSGEVTPSSAAGETTSSFSAEKADNSPVSVESLNRTENDMANIGASVVSMAPIGVHSSEVSTSDSQHVPLSPDMGGAQPSVKVPIINSNNNLGDFFEGQSSLPLPQTRDPSVVLSNQLLYHTQKGPKTPEEIVPDKGLTSLMKELKDVLHKIREYRANGGTQASALRPMPASLSEANLGLPSNLGALALSSQSMRRLQGIDRKEIEQAFASLNQPQQQPTVKDMDIENFSQEIFDPGLRSMEGRSPPGTSYGGFEGGSMEGVYAGAAPSLFDQNTPAGLPYNKRTEISRLNKTQKITHSAKRRRKMSRVKKRTK